MEGLAGDKCRRRREVTSLLWTLIARRDCFFDRHGVLNSDGRRILARAVKACGEDYSLHRLLLRVLRDPTFERVQYAYNVLAGELEYP